MLTETRRTRRQTRSAAKTQIGEATRQTTDPQADSLQTTAIATTSSTRISLRRPDTAIGDDFTALDATWEDFQARHEVAH